MILNVGERHWEVYRGKHGESYLTKTCLESWTAVVGQWLLHCPTAHPAWRHWLSSVIHLRPLVGIPKAELLFEGATHEWSLTAMDSEKGPVRDDKSTWTLLSPTCYMAQMRLTSQVFEEDDVAFTIGEQMSRRAVEGFYVLEPQGVQGARTQIRELLENLADEVERVVVQGE